MFLSMFKKPGSLLMLFGILTLIAGAAMMVMAVPMAKQVLVAGGIALAGGAMLSAKGGGFGLSGLFEKEGMPDGYVPRSAYNKWQDELKELDDQEASEKAQNPPPLRYYTPPANVLPQFQAAVTATIADKVSGYTKPVSVEQQALVNTYSNPNFTAESNAWQDKIELIELKYKNLREAAYNVHIKPFNPTEPLKIWDGN